MNNERKLLKTLLCHKDNNIRPFITNIGNVDELHDIHNNHNRTTSAVKTKLTAKAPSSDNAHTQHRSEWYSKIGLSIARGDLLLLERLRDREGSVSLVSTLNFA